MLKKFFKAALTACVVVGMSSTAMAWAPIGNSGLMAGFSTTASFGQYNSGIEDESAYLMGKGTTHFSFFGQKGKWKAWGDIEYDDHPQMHRSTVSPANAGSSCTDAVGDSCGVTIKTGKEIDAVVGYVSYLPSPQMEIKLGNIHHLAGLHYSNDNEMSSYVVGHAGWNYSGYTEAPGIALYYTISPELKIQLSYYWEYAAEMTGRGEGTAQALDVNGKFGGIMFQVGYLTEVKADHTDKDFEADPNTFTNFGVKVPIGDAMLVVFDYTTTTLSYGIKDHKENITDMGLQFQMGGVGPGRIFVTYAMQTGEDPDEAFLYSGSGVKWNTTDMNLMYQIAAGPGAMEFQYATETANSTNAADVEADAVTKSWMGVAFKFAM